MQMEQAIASLSNRHRSLDLPAPLILAVSYCCIDKEHVLTRRDNGVRENELQSKWVGGVGWGGGAGLRDDSALAACEASVSLRLERVYRGFMPFDPGP